MATKKQVTLYTAFIADDAVKVDAHEYTQTAQLYIISKGFPGLKRVALTALPAVGGLTNEIVLAASEAEARGALEKMLMDAVQSARARLERCEKKLAAVQGSR